MTGGRTAPDYTGVIWGVNMNWCKAVVIEAVVIEAIFGAALLAAGMASGASPALAQTFRNYRCADGSRFMVGFFQYDKRAHLQVDGRAVTLAKDLALSGSRYSGGGVTLKIGGAGTTFRHAKRPTTTCELI
jgi:membrane-bound inhibitor of C-type lysozyme